MFELLNESLKKIEETEIENENFTSILDESEDEFFEKVDNLKDDEVVTEEDEVVTEEDEEDLTGVENEELPGDAVVTESVEQFETLLEDIDFRLALESFDSEFQKNIPDSTDVIENEEEEEEEYSDEDLEMVDDALDAEDEEDDSDDMEEEYSDEEEEEDDEMILNELERKLGLCD